MKEHIDRELLVKYIQGECTPAELEEVRQFLFQPEWQQALEDLLEEDFAAFHHTPPAEEGGREWNKHFLDRYTAARPARHSILRSRWIGYAAACIIVIGAAWWLAGGSPRHGTTNGSAIAMLEHATSRGKRLKITLPDSSVIYLGPASRIRYPEKFGQLSRDVILEGNAYFEVTPDKLHPFTVQTGTISTRVLGTSFKIDAFDDIAVSVATGKVQVNGKDRELALLTPGQQVKWNKETGQTILGEADIDEIKEWKDGKVTFVSAPLADIAATLERWYDVDIRFSDEQTANIRLSLIIKATVPVQHSLDIICSTAHLEYNADHNIFTITKK